MGFMNALNYCSNAIYAIPTKGTIDVQHSLVKINADRVQGQRGGRR